MALFCAPWYCYSAVSDTCRTPEDTYAQATRQPSSKAPPPDAACAVRKKARTGPRLSPGVGLGYRRNAGPGTWSVRSTDGHGADWIKRIGARRRLRAEPTAATS